MNNNLFLLLIYVLILLRVAILFPNSLFWIMVTQRNMKNSMKASRTSMMDQASILVPTLAATSGDVEPSTNAITMDTQLSTLTA